MKEKNCDIELLRILFTTIVMLHHLGIVPFLHHGYISVEFFFILSGYLLHHSYQIHAETAVKYTLRKLKRFYPYYIASAIGILLVKIVVNIIQGGVKAIPVLLMRAVSESLMLQSTGIYISNNSPMWYLTTMILGGYFVYYLLRLKEDFYCKFIAPITILISYSYIFSESDTIEIWGTLSGIYIPLLRAIAGLNVGVVIYCIVVKVRNVCREHNSLGKVIQIISVLSILGGIVMPQSVDKYLMIPIVILVMGCFIWERKSLHKWYFLVADNTFYMYLTHFTVAYIFNFYLTVTNTNLSGVKAIIFAVIYMFLVYIYSIFLKNIVDIGIKKFNEAHRVD
ncbi:MAG: acyltransferase [Lachnospiraceae bacterium]|nr:acyltransferase [Lachnospiraceae bacterium]